MTAVGADAAVPAAARRRLEDLGESITRRDAAIPGIGPITALSLALRVDPTPREHSSGGKQRR